jgi:hypothetical protein
VLVLKVPNARADHRKIPLVGRGDHFGIFYRTTRLNGTRGARFGRGDQSIGEREERIAADGAPLQ